MRHPSFALLLLLVLPAGALAQKAGGPLSRLPDQPPLRESFDLTVPHPPAPVVVEGRQQFTYELHLTNFSRDTLRLQTVRVVDETSRETLLLLAGTGLDGQLQAVRMTTGPAKAPTARDIAPGARGILYLELESPREKALGSLRHEIEYTAQGAAPTFTVSGGQATIDTTTPVVLGPPLRGGPWAAVHSAAWPRGHRRVLYTVEGAARIPGRYAIDWVRVDASGRIATAEADKAAAALGYGAPVLAVAEATVVATRDDLRESAKVSQNPQHSLAEAAGNFVLLQLGNGRYAVYEHLQPGSIRVRPGERVRRGQAIAALGFTGDTTGPHLHFHVTDRPSLLGGEGVPYVFEAFSLLGQCVDVSKLGSAKWQAVRPGIEARRTRELPGPNVVLLFSE